MAFKITIGLKLIMIYHKSNSDFRSHINFGGHKVDIEVDIYHYSNSYDLNSNDNT
jgi:hypothetical protein